jgi:hypothetical protein
MKHTLDAKSNLTDTYASMRMMLCDKARAMTTMGMDAEDIWYQVERMDKAIKELDSAFGKDLSAAVKASGDASRNMLHATIAGITITTKEKS